MDKKKIKFAHPVPPFVRYCSAIIPTMFDDSLSYYEALCALNNFIQRNIVEVINQNAAISQSLLIQFEELKTFVDTYFDNLDVQQEINNKLDEMAESGELADLIAAYAATKVNYFYITSSSSEDDIINAFADNHSKVIEFEKGVYEIENNIILTSNTVINLNGSEIKNKTSSPMIFGYALDSEYTGYDGVSNITFNNGKLNICTALMHNTNIKYNNITFGSDIVTHAVQMAGCKNIEFNSCTFNGLLNNDPNAAYLEMVQIETCTYAGQPWLDQDSASYDHTSCENIKFDDCYFSASDPVSTSIYTAIGTHSIDNDNLVAGKNISIKNCYIDNPKYAGLTICGFDNLTFENNTVFCNRSTSDSIMVLRFMSANNNSIIRNNKFIGGKNILYNTNAKLCDGLVLEGNYFNTDYDNSIAITIRCWNNVKIINNEFIGSKKYYIDVVTSSIADTHNDNISICNNTFNTDALTASSSRDIYLEDGSNIHIANNLFKAAANGHYVTITGNNASNYIISENNFDNPSGVYASLVDGSSIDYSQIYDDYANVFTGANATYSAYTNQNPSIPFAKFNKILIKLHKNNDASKLVSIPCYAFTTGNKLDARTYPLVYSDGTTISSCTLTINNDGTFNYASSDSVVLRNIVGVNDNTSN